MPFLLALFPFLHDQTYEVQITSCEQNSIVASYEGVPFTLSLFNIGIKDEKGWQKTCELLTNAERVEIELDTSVSISEPVNAYIFIDDTLLQEQLIKEEIAYTLIHNPEYTYQNKLSQIENSQHVLATSPIKKNSDAYGSTSIWFLFMLFMSWLCMLVYLFIGVRKKSFFPTRQTK